MPTLLKGICYTGGKRGTSAEAKAGMRVLQKGWPPQALRVRQLLQKMQSSRCSVQSVGGKFLECGVARS